MLAAMRWLRLNFPLRNNIFLLREFIAAKNWDGTGSAPHPIKQETIRKYAARYGIRVFVETGTFYGDMIAAMLPYFDRLYSIELSPFLHAKAQRRFRGQNHVNLICGDSAVALGSLLDTLTEPALLWLDGHYSGGVTAKGESDTPVYNELAHIRVSRHKNVVLIDDARCFGSDPAYPSLQELESYLGRRLHVEADAIVIEP